MFQNKENTYSPMTTLANDLLCTSLDQTDEVEDQANARLNYEMNCTTPLIKRPKRMMKSSLNLNSPTGSNGPGANINRQLTRRLLANSPLMDENSTSPINSPSKYTMVRQMRNRGPLGDFDSNSHDSGLSEDSKSNFRFAEPSKIVPKRQSSDITSQSPRRNLLNSPSFSDSGSSSLTSSLENSDEGYQELFQLDKMDEDAQMAPRLDLFSSDLINDYLSNSFCINGCTPTSSPKLKYGSPMRKHPQTHPRTSFRRCISGNITPVKILSRDGDRDVPEFKKRKLNSYDDDYSTPQQKRNRCLGPICEDNENIPIQSNFRGTLFQYGFKKGNTIKSHGAEQSILEKKSTKVLSPVKDVTNIQLNLNSRVKPKLQHSLSAPEAYVKQALQRSVTHENLIGDFTLPHILPLKLGKHQDLKTISCDTLAKLLRGEFTENVENYKIIDCRYPYEFNGGHINGALNIYSQELLLKELIDIKQESSQSNEKRKILVFHCEFSSERGPKLYRYLRQEDRATNAYPSLTYPEVYLLDGGYKAFYETTPELCTPQNYTPMRDPDHLTDLKHFRARAKSTSQLQKRSSIRSLSRLF